MKEIRTDGITFISPVSEGTEEWYYGLNYDHGDLYEAEELYKQGFEIDGRDLILIRYPEGKIFRPVPKMKGTYVESPVYLENGIYILMVDFEDGKIIIYRFDCEDLETSVVKVLPMDMIADCYNLKLTRLPYVSQDREQKTGVLTSTGLNGPALRWVSTKRFSSETITDCISTNGMKRVMVRTTGSGRRP